MTRTAWLRGALKRRLVATRRVWQRGDAHLAMVKPPPEAEPEAPPLRLPAAAVDAPLAGATAARGVLRVVGWAATRSGPCARIELSINGRSVGQARLGHPRPDLETASGVPAAMFAGFETMIDLAALPWLAERAELTGVGVGMDGSVVQLPVVAFEVASDETSAPVQHGDPGSLRLTVPTRPCAGSLRVLVCTHELGYGGAQLFLTELMRQVCRRHAVDGTVLSPVEGPTRGQFEALGFDVHVCGQAPLSGPEQYEARIEELAAWALHKEFDVGFVNTMVAFPGGDVCSRIGLPMIWAIHESYTLPNFWGTYGDALDPAVRARGTEALRSADILAFTCAGTRACYEPYVGSLRCATLPYGIDVDALDEWRAGYDRRSGRAEMGFAEDELVVLCMATLADHKGQIPLIQAFAQIAGRHPGAVLQIVGSRGDSYSDAAHRAARVAGLGDRVRIEPVSADVRPMYANADLMVSASDLESTPRSMLEAMALGLPVLATSVFGVPELIDHGRTGWLCKPRDVLALAEGLDCALAASREERAAIASNAREMIVREYRSDVCSEAWAVLLREAARAAPGAIAEAAHG